MKDLFRKIFGPKGKKITAVGTTSVRTLETVLSNNDKFICTQEEFDDFQNYGYLIPMGKSYLTRMGKKISVDVIKQKVSIMTINLSEIITEATNFANECNYKRVYCMSENTYAKYENNGYIIEKDNNKYYRYFESELWLVMIV